MAARLKQLTRRSSGTKHCALCPLGTLGYEVLNSVPSFNLGIPTIWVTQSQADYYNGRMKDIHGKPIGTEYKERELKGVAINPDDPPVFESQSSYLERHGLLEVVERERLRKADYEPVRLDKDYF